MAFCVVCAGPAAVYCHNDEAYLCKECDLKVHSANLLASRHNRTQVCTIVTEKPAPPCIAPTPCVTHEPVVPAVEVPEPEVNFDEDGLPDWDTLLDSSTDVHTKGAKGGEDAKALGFGVDPFDTFDLDNLWMDRLDKGFEQGFDEAMPNNLLRETSSEGLVPNLEPSVESVADSRSEAVVESAPAPVMHTPVSAPAPVPHLNAQASFSSTHMHGAIAPQAVSQFNTAAPAVPASYNPVATYNAAPAAPYQPVGFPSVPGVPADNLTRAERVERYRQKRKNRKFEKTIRYASRKAYAEIRPRIKGRFATKAEVAQMRLEAAARLAAGGDGSLQVPQGMAC